MSQDVSAGVGLVGCIEQLVWPSVGSVKVMSIDWITESGSTLIPCLYFATFMGISTRCGGLLDGCSIYSNPSMWALGYWWHLTKIAGVSTH
jgi:hypothetical protein